MTIAPLYRWGGRRSQMLETVKPGLKHGQPDCKVSFYCQDSRQCLLHRVVLRIECDHTSKALSAASCHVVSAVNVTILFAKHVCMGCVKQVQRLCGKCACSISQ